MYNYDKLERACLTNRLSHKRFGYWHKARTSAFVLLHHRIVHFGIDYCRTIVYHRNFCQPEWLRLIHRVRNIGCRHGKWWHHKGDNMQESI